jgi:hypothetical protein
LEDCVPCILLLVDSELDLETLRLYMSAALTAQVARSIGRRVATDSNAGDLLALARSLRTRMEHAERVHRISFDPPYPGVTSGVEAVGGGLRLLLACRASDRDGRQLGVVFTTLIPGRSPQVSLAPAGAPVPEEWRTP